jgi:two-component system response regulator
MTEALPLDLLLIEDNPEDAEMVLRCLHAHDLAHRSLVLEDGAQALDFLLCRGEYAGRPKGLMPRLVIVDIKLPKVSGLEVLREVKREDSLRAVPVVVFTSSREVVDLRTAYSSGANSYVVKPMKFREFEESIVRMGNFWLQVNEPFNLD